MFATLDMTMLAGLAFDTNGRFIGLFRYSLYLQRLPKISWRIVGREGATMLHTQAREAAKSASHPGVLPC